MRRLRGGILRALTSHKSAEGELYGDSCPAFLRQCGPLPVHALPMLREWGLALVDLKRLREDLEVARTKPNRRQEVRRLERRSIAMRKTLVSLQRELTEQAAASRSRPASLAEAVAQRQGGAR